MAIVSLALGIGANAAIFALFDQTLLRAVPVPHPDELVNFANPGPKPGSTSCNQAGGCDEVFSYPMFRDLEKIQQVFTGIAAHVSFQANLAFRSQTMNSQGMLVSGSYFPVLGLQASLGRLLDQRDDQNIGGHFVAVLSHAFRTTHFGASPSVPNETLIVNGQSLTIVGAAPRGFKGTVLGSEPAVFVPITMRGQMSPGWKGFDNRQSYRHQGGQRCHLHGVAEPERLRCRARAHVLQAPGGGTSGGARRHRRRRVGRPSPRREQLGQRRLR